VPPGGGAGPQAAGRGREPGTTGIAGASGKLRGAVVAAGPRGRPAELPAVAGAAWALSRSRAGG